MEEKKFLDIQALRDKVGKIEVLFDHNEIMSRVKQSKTISLTISDEQDISLSLSVKTNSPNNPISFVNKVYFNNLISINPSYYDNNRDSVLQIINELACSDLCIYEYDENILDSIVNNPNIKTLHLSKLDLKSFDILKKRTDLRLQVNSNNIDCIDPSLINIFDGKIINNINRSLVMNYNYKDLQSLEDINITEQLSQEEIDYLARYGRNIKIMRLESKQALDIINKMNNPAIKYEIDIKQYVPTSVMSELKGNNISILYREFSSNYLPLQEYLKISKKLDDMVTDIENLDLSPLEKFLYIFNKTKHYKKYKESDNRNESRYLQHILDDNKDYIVCVGYASLLSELCNRIGIPWIENNVSLNNISKDKYSQPHTKLMIKIVDAKYGVNGCYQTDPTFSSDLEKDYYPTALMTVNEAHASSLHYYCDNSVIYASESYEEFAIRIRKMVMKNHYDLRSLLENMDKLKNLDESFTNMDSYKTFNSLVFKDEKHAYELLSDEGFIMNLYDHIKKTYQSPISGNVLIEAIKNVKRVENPNISESELDEMMSTIIDDNIMAYDHYFPPITIEGSRTEIFANKYNKFITSTQENIKSI